MSRATYPQALSGTPVGRAIHTLEEIARHKGQPCTLDHLATATALPLATMRRLLRGLVKQGLLNEDADNASYTLGPRSLSLSSLIYGSLPLEKVARPLMQELVATFDETSTLNAYLPVEGKNICVAVEECRKPIQYKLEPGEVKYLHSGAAGKAILAFLPDRTVDLIIKRHGLVEVAENAVTSRARLARDLARIRREGVAVTRGERINGAVGIAAPVFGSAGTVLASLCLTIPMIRCTETAIAGAKREIKRQANRLSQFLGYSATPGPNAVARNGARPVPRARARQGKKS